MDEAVSSFLVSLGQSVGIVVAALMLTMGWRAGLTVGATLGLTVLGTVFFMAVFGIEMERLTYLLVLCGLFLALVCINGVFKMRINTFVGIMSERLLRRLRRGIGERVPLLTGGAAAHAYAADIRRDHAILMEDLRTLSETLATQRAAYR